MQPPVEAVWQMRCSGQHEMSWNPSTTFRPEHGSYMNLCCPANESWQQSQYCMCLLTHDYPRSGRKCFTDTGKRSDFPRHRSSKQTLCDYGHTDCKARDWDTGKLCIINMKDFETINACGIRKKQDAWLLISPQYHAGHLCYFRKRSKTKTTALGK